MVGETDVTLTFKRADWGIDFPGLSLKVRFLAFPSLD